MTTKSYKMILSQLFHRKCNMRALGYTTDTLMLRSILSVLAR